MFKVLSDLYDNLIENHADIPKISFSYSRVSFLITIDQNGIIRDIVDVRISTEGKKDKKNSQVYLLPAISDKNGNGFFPDFLCGGMDYLTGYWESSKKKENEEKEKEEKANLDKANGRYRACRELHLALLDKIDTVEANALKLYFTSEKSPYSSCHQTIQESIRIYGKEKGLVAFRLYETGTPITFERDEFQEIQDCWTDYYIAVQKEKAEKGFCIVKGMTQPIANMAFRISGLSNGHTSGSRMIGSNDESLYHFGKKGTSGNHPISFEVMRKAELALDYLNTKRQYIRIGSTEGTNPQFVKVYYWATGKNYSGAIDFFQMCIQGLNAKQDSYEETKVKLINAMSELSSGRAITFDAKNISPETDFYLLGLEGNVARGVLSFLYHNTFSYYAENLHKHYMRASLPQGQERRMPTPYWILKSVLRNDNEVKNNMAKGLLMSILNDAHYPDDLINRAIQREHVGSDQNQEIRVCFLKAYIEQKKEAGMSLEKNEAIEKAKKLGELFAWYEYIQYKASGRVGSNIKDRFYKKMMETPALVLPSIDKLASAHYKSIQREGKSTLFFEKTVAGLYNEIGNIPVKLTRDEQCAFVSGYYTQRLAHFSGSDKIETTSEKSNYTNEEVD